MKAILPLLFFGVLAGSCIVGAAGKLPAFRVERWVNSAPLTAAGLRGKVVLVDVSGSTPASTGFVPCPMSRPGIASTSLGLVVIGVHSPEFEFGKRVRTSTVGFAITG